MKLILQIKNTAKVTKYKFMFFNSDKAFTLIELLVVIAILTVLLAITLIAINPQAQFRKANNSKRASDVNALLNAISQWSADNYGALPQGTGSPIPTHDGSLGVGSALIVRPADGVREVDLCYTLVPEYIAALPIDPSNGSANGGNTSGVSNCGAAYDTGYHVSQGTGGNSRVTVWSLTATPTFAVSR